MTRVLEIGGLAAGYCGRLFVEAGADVVRVSWPTPGAWVSDAALDTFLHAGKRSVDGLDTAVLADLAEASDVLVLDGTAAEVAPYLDAAFEPRHARVAITPFGTTGPRSGWRATGATLLAMGGYTHLIGDPGREPLTLSGHYVEYQSGQHAFIAAMALLLEGQRGQDVDVSMWEVVLSLSQFTTVMYTCDGDIRERHGSAFGLLYPVNQFRCVDGWFHVNVVPQFWDAFVCMLDRPELAIDPQFVDNDARLENREALDTIIAAALGNLTRSEVLARGEAARVPTGIVLSLDELVGDPQLAARDFWRDRDRVRVPASPFRRMT